MFNKKINNIYLDVPSWVPRIIWGGNLVAFSFKMLTSSASKQWRFGIFAVGLQMAIKLNQVKSSNAIATVNKPINSLHYNPARLRLLLPHADKYELFGLIPSTNVAMQNEERKVQITNAYLSAHIVTILTTSSCMVLDKPPPGNRSF